MNSGLKRKRGPPFGNQNARKHWAPAPDPGVRCPGAPVGNQNARTHGFYSSVLDAEQQRILQEVSGMKGIDEEINLLRVKLYAVVEHDPNNLRLFYQAATALARLLRVRDSLSQRDDTDLQTALKNILTGITCPSGAETAAPSKAAARSE